jgi:hypothetical protein
VDGVDSFLVFQPYSCIYFHFVVVCATVVVCSHLANDAQMATLTVSPRTLAPPVDPARKSRYISTPCRKTILIGLSLTSHHLTLASVLAGEMCEHCHAEASGGIDLPTLIRYVEQGCSYYRIVLCAVDWAIPTLFTYADIELIFGFKLDRIHVSRRNNRNSAERVYLTVFRVRGRLIFAPFETFAYLDGRISTRYSSHFSGTIRKAA